MPQKPLKILNVLFKMPKCLTNGKGVELLLGSTIQIFLKEKKNQTYESLSVQVQWNPRFFKTSISPIMDPWVQDSLEGQKEKSAIRLVCHIKTLLYNILYAALDLYSLHSSIKVCHSHSKWLEVTRSLYCRSLISVPGCPNIIDWAQLENLKYSI